MSINIMRTKPLVVLVTFASFLLVAGESSAGDTIVKGEVLTVEWCVEIGLESQPDVIAARAALDSSRARKEQASSGYYPRLDASAGYTRSDYDNGTSGGEREQYSTGVTAMQTIFDFGKTSTQVNIGTLNIDASEADLAAIEASVVLDIRKAYYGLLRARGNLSVARETVEQSRRHLERAEAFFRAGTKPRFDVTRAEVDLSSARLDMITAENAVHLAVVSLNNAMGVPDAPVYEVEDAMGFVKVDIGAEEALRAALEQRPELKAMLARKKAAEAAVRLARKGYGPILSGSAGWAWAGKDFAEGDGWNAGLSLSVPIFSGYLTRGQVSEAEAAMAVIEAKEEALKQDVVMEVRQAYLNLLEAEQRIKTAELTVKLAEENFEIANGRYEAGVGDPIEVADAELMLSGARTARLQALYDYNVARASLERATGSR